MKYLLDSNIIINHLRGKKPIDPTFVKVGCSLSIISQAELFYGVYKSSQQEKNLTKVKAMLIDLGIGVINLNEEIINEYGKLKAQLEKKGKKLDEFDLLIAATAIKSNLILVTENLSHFQRIPQLKIV